MKIFIKAKTNAKSENVEQLQPRLESLNTRQSDIPTLKVSVKALPTDGKANDAIIHLLAAHFKVPRAQVRIVSGHTTNQKIVEIGGLLLRK